MLDSLTTKHKIILATLGFLVITIPVSAFIISYRLHATLNSKANSEDATIQDLSLRPIVDNPTPEKTLLDQLKEDLSTPSASPDLSDDTSTSGTTLNLGPTLTFKIQKEGRKKDDQTEPKLFVGLAIGQATKNPQYLLSFTVEIKADGTPKDNLSIAGVSVGDTYTAYIKGQTTLTASSTFTAKPTTSDLGTINLLVGDLNDDNAVDQKDRDLFMKSFGANTSSQNWNPLADFNDDGVINTSDLAYITKNMNKNGASGPWYSTTPPSATASATPSGSLLKTPTPSPNLGGPPSPQGEPEEATPRDLKPIQGKGYWMWVPTQ